MSEDIQELIEKIRQEGIKTAEDKAKEIEEQARQKAGDILKQAREEAETLLKEAEAKIAQMEQASSASLKQAGRDLLLSLRAEIAAILNKIIAFEAREALGAEELPGIIAALVKQAAARQKGQIVVSVSKNDLRRLRHGLLGKLSAEAKKGVSLKAETDIKAGFIISYDQGKSHYDFTDKSLAEYLSLYLRPQLAELLQKAAKKS